MSIVTEGARVRRSISFMAAMALVGSVAGSGAVFAQGPAAPPPPPNLDLPTGGGHGGGNTGAGGGAGAAGPNAAPGNMGQGGNDAGGNADNGANQDLPAIVIQGTVKSVSGSSVTIAIRNGASATTRTVDTSDAVYESAAGAKIDKFAVKTGDALLIVGETPDASVTAATPLKALIIEKNATQAKTAK